MMKPNTIKTILATMLLWVAYVTPTYAQNSRLYHNVEETNGVKKIHVYKLNEDTHTFQQYKESTIIYDELNRPIQKTVLLWDEDFAMWIPIQSFIYSYDSDNCTIDLDWNGEYALNKDEHYQFPIE